MLLLFGGPPPGTIVAPPDTTTTLVRSNSKYTAGDVTTATITLPTVGAGHGLVIGSTTYTGTLLGNISNVTDSAGGVWARNVMYNSNDGDQDIWYCKSHPGAAGTVTVTVTYDFATSIALVVGEFSRAFTSSRTGLGVDSGGSSVSSQPITVTSASGDVVVAVQQRYDNVADASTAPISPAALVNYIAGTNTAATMGWVVANSTSTAVTFASPTPSSITTIGVALVPSPVAPVVNAGGDVSQNTGVALVRTGAASNSPTSYAWTIFSGPSGAGTTISSTASLNWTPSVAGTYTLRLTATNTAGSGYDDIVITVADAPVTPSVVQVRNYGQSGYETTTSVTLPGAVVAGHALVAMVSSYSINTTSDPITSVTDNAGNTWVQVAQLDEGTYLGTISMWYVQSSNASAAYSASFTQSDNTGNGHMSVTLVEWDRALIAQLPATTKITGVTDATSRVLTATASSTTGSLVLGVANAYFSTVLPADAPATTLGQMSSPTSLLTGWTVGNAGTTSITWTGTSNQRWMTIGAAFSPPAPPAVPVANAGADATVGTNTVFTRTGTATNSPTSYAWTILSGPAGVGTTIGTAAALSWTPTVAGTYTLRFSATNGTGTGTDDIVVTVGAVATVARRAVGAVTLSSTTSISIPYPTHVVGDILLMFISNHGTTAPTVPNWTLVGSQPVASGTTLYVLWRYASAVYTGSETVTGSTATARTGVIISYSGASTTAPTLVTGVSNVSNSSVSNAVTGPGFTVWALASNAATTTVGTVLASAGTYNDSRDVVGNTANNQLYVDNGTVSNNGSTTLSAGLGSFVPYGVIAILIPPGLVQAPTTTGYIKAYNGTAFVSKPVKWWNGTAWTVKPVKRWDGTTWKVT